MADRWRGAGSLGALFPTFREIVGWSIPVAPSSQLVPGALVVLALALGAALGPMSEDSLAVPAVLASVAIGAVATAWVFVLAAGADRPVGVAIEMTAIVGTGMVARAAIARVREPLWRGPRRGWR